jgi:hypothetical protein
MKTRHRMPTIFSIYMVDVLCCALGCVILLWLINLRDAKQGAAAASETGKRLTESRSALELSQSELASMRRTITDAHEREKGILARLKSMQVAREDLDKLLLLARKEHGATKQALRLSESQLADLRVALKDLQGKSARTSEQLTLKTAAVEELLKQLTAAELKSLELNKELTLKAGRLKQADIAALLLSRQMADLKAVAKDYKSKLSLAEIRARLLQDDLDRNKKALVDTKSLAEARARLTEEDLAKGKKELILTRKLYEDMLAAQELLSKRLLQSTRDLKTAQAAVDNLKEEKLTLAQQARLIRLAAERRFAGITLTGQNVLFLVDMSGSMELIDENTPDPDKWPLVCETVARIMESMADLRQYQVILFSDKVRYPMGNNGRWLRNTSDAPKTVLASLKAVKPSGETNMAAVFEEAFRYRDDGVDTIYVLSDGLPNAGPGLPPGSQNLSDTQKTEILSKYVRNRLKYVLNRNVAGQPRVRINTIGFFFESPDVGAFLWALAREHQGSFVGMSK